MESLITSFLVWFVSTVGVIPSFIILVASTIILYTCYIVLNYLRKKYEKDKLQWYHYIYGIPIIVIGIPIDFLFNIIFGMIIYREVPKEFLFTSRIQRWKDKDEKDYRTKLSQWICKTMLNPVTY